MTKKIIGVDLGGTSVKLAILDVLGNKETLKTLKMNKNINYSVFMIIFSYRI